MRQKQKERERERQEIGIILLNCGGHIPRFLRSPPLSFGGPREWHMNMMNDERYKMSEGWASILNVLVYKK